MQPISMRSLVFTFAAIVATASLVLLGMEGLTSVLALIPIFLGAWIWTRYTRREVGFSLGSPPVLALAVLYPLAVITGLSIFALAGGAQFGAKEGMAVAGQNWLMIFLLTLVLAILTEEGFFRGWLWASLKKDGCSRGAVLALSSVAFSLWHVAEILFSKSYSLGPLAATVILINAVLIGAIWGIVRSLGSSIVLSSLSHAVWNASTYVIFGDGNVPGVLQMQTSVWVHPERGLLGLLLNGVLLFLLYRSWRTKEEW